MFEYQATLDRVIDGDTYVLVIDLGFEVHVKTHARLLGVNTPEMRGTERPAGLGATRFVQQWFDQTTATAAAAGTEWELRVVSHDMNHTPTSKHPTRKGKYGRWLVDIYNHNNDSLADAIRQAGHDQP